MLNMYLPEITLEDKCANVVKDNSNFVPIPSILKKDSDKPTLESKILEMKSVKINVKDQRTDSIMSTESDAIATITKKNATKNSRRFKKKSSINQVAPNLEKFEDLALRRDSEQDNEQKEWIMQNDWINPVQQLKHNTFPIRKPVKKPSIQETIPEPKENTIEKKQTVPLKAESLLKKSIIFTIANQMPEGEGVRNSIDYTLEDIREAEKTAAEAEAQKNKIDKNKTYAVIYGLTMIVFGVLLPIVETATTGTKMATQTADMVFETILFSVSLIWFIFVIVDVHLYLWQSKNDERRYRYKENYTHGSHDDGGLYIRIGCGFFCMASLLHYGLELAQAFNFDGLCDNNTKLIIRNSTRFSFTFLQYAFLFKNSSVIIKSHYCFAYFGLAHLIVTNICVWFKYILEETLTSVKETVSSFTNLTESSSLFNLEFIHDAFERQQMETSYVTYTQNASINITSCRILSNQVTDITHRLNIFLIPCAIEFSIVCVTLYYVIWKNVGKVEHSVIKRRYSQALRATQVFYIDCNNSMKGLFAGIFIMLLTLIIIIIYLISGGGHITDEDLSDFQSFNVLGILLSETLESALLFLNCVAIIHALISIKDFNHVANKTTSSPFAVSFEELLVIFALFGVISFSLFRILSFRYTPDKSLYTIFLFINGILSFIAAILQTVFILAANRKEGVSLLGITNRKGREQVTFLIIINLALWFLYSVTRSKYANVLFKNPIVNPSQIQAMQNAQAIKWIIINTISYPLMLYFNFHCSCCLSHIWKKCYSRTPTAHHNPNFYNMEI